MAEGEEDPFASLIHLCKPTSSQEVKFQNCPFARESETFLDQPDSLASSSSPSPTSSEETGIIMLSLPDTDSDADNGSIDKNDPEDNEVFQTPPEHQRLSSSSQEDLPQPSKPVAAAVGEKTEGSDDVETAAVDDGVGLGEEEENLGFSETEKMDGVDDVSGGDCSDCGSEAEEIEGFKRQLKRFRVSEAGKDEPDLKKIRVSEGKDLETHTLCIEEDEIDEKVNNTEVIDVDSEETEEGIGFDAGKMTSNVESLVKDSDKNARTSENGEIKENGDEVLDGRTMDTGDIDKSKSSSDGGDRRNDEGLDLDSVLKLLNSVSTALEEYEEVLRDDGNNEMKDNGLTVNVDLAREEFEDAVRDNGNTEVQGNGEGASGSKSIEEIEKFRYEGCAYGVDRLAKEAVFRGRRELPLSIRAKEKDAGGWGRSENVEVKSGSWKELVDVLALVFREVDGSCEDVDFLETAKRRGLTFPQPRWI